MGRHNVNNALAALATGGVSGISLENMAAQLALPVTVPGRLQAVVNNKGFQVFVDYAHTDDALANVLGALREVRHDRLLVVFGCGGNRDTGKRAAMGAVAARWADYTVLTSDNPRKEDPGAIIAQIQSGFADAGRYEVVVDREQAIGRILELAKPGDIVLIAGKGHETYQEFADKKIPFDDRDVARRILEAM
jgi:UDP-N-acetylmuramoyl-L-alanyl-D-glutamate--2,6-diaminopimelate ligase